MNAVRLIDCVALALEHYSRYPTACLNDVKLHECCSRPEDNFVYELLVNGELVYVGASIDANSRLKQHIAARDEKSIELGEVVKCCCLTSAANLEEMAIKRLDPPWNKMHSPSKPKRKIRSRVKS